MHDDSEHVGHEAVSLACIIANLGWKSQVDEERGKEEKLDKQLGQVESIRPTTEVRVNIQAREVHV